MSSTYTSLRSKAGIIPILRKNIGSKAIKMVYSDDLTPGKTVETIDVDEADSSVVLYQRRRHHRTGPYGRDH